jgi:replicative DNA helicase
VQRDEAVDPVTLRVELERLRENVVDVNYVMGMFETLPSVRNWRDYAGIVKEMSLRRRLLAMADEVQNIAQDNQHRAQQLVERVVSLSLQLGQHGKRKHETGPLGDALAEVYAMMEDAAANPNRKPPVRFGLTWLDKMAEIAGFTLIGARTGHGKSALIGSLIESSDPADRDGDFLVYDCEMGKHMLAFRLLSSETGIDLRRMTKGQLTDVEWRRTVEGISHLSSLGVELRCGSWDIDELVADVKVTLLERKVSAVIVDYAQRVRAPGDEYQRNTTISLKLADIYQEHGIPVIATVQLNRHGDSDDLEDELHLKDIKGSGQYEQDAHLVVFVQNPTPLGMDKRPSREARVHVKKQRMGPVGSSKLWWDGPTLRFTDMETEREVPNTQREPKEDRR